MIVNDETTWPADVLDYLHQHRDPFLAWERRGGCRGQSNKAIAEIRAVVAIWERAILGLRAVLNHHTLHGYHCTRLTKREIQSVLLDGLQIPDREMLCARIQALQEAGEIEPHIAKKLMQDNEAGDALRAGLLWFCFFAPHIGGQSGIECFFRYWGGEALYIRHCRDAVTGPVIEKIGTPCLVEVDVPIAHLAIHTSLESHIVNKFLINRGLKTLEPTDHEDRATCPVSADYVRRIIRFPEPDFVMLTRCDKWRPPLL